MKKKLINQAAGSTKTWRRLAGLAMLAVLVVVCSAYWPASVVRAQAAMGAGFQPTVVNVSAAISKTPPPGMAWIPGGEFSMGANDPPDMDDVGMKATKDARPIHRVYVDAFFIDKTDVTNAEFAKFVKATGYVTIAESKPRPEDSSGCAT